MLKKTAAPNFKLLHCELPETRLSSVIGIHLQFLTFPPAWLSSYWPASASWPQIVWI